MPSIKSTLPLRFTKLRTLEPGNYRDGHVKELLVRVSPNGATVSFYYQNEVSVKGVRNRMHKLIGHWPEVSPERARIEAKKITGRAADGHIEPGRRRAVRFEDAFTRYLVHLQAQATKRGKPARWHKAVVGYGKLHISPRWGRVTLADMSRDPGGVADWHVKLTADAGPITADRCCQIIRATYRHEARRNRSLPVQWPTSAVAFNGDTPRETGIDDWRAWAAAWRAIPSPVRRGYVLCSLLTGCRPTEIGLLSWSRVHLGDRVLIIGKSKSGVDIRVPMSWPIAAAMRLARGADSDLVFPGARHNPTRDKLPAFGNSLRHAWRTVVADLKVDDLLAHCLLGHAPRGVSQGYISRIALSMWPAMRSTQRQISRRILGLLGLTVAELRSGEG